MTRMKPGGRFLRRLNSGLTSGRIALRAETLLLKARLRGMTPTMQHGLQRSGTNYLLLALLHLGIPVVNYRDPARSASRHKHCRWQHDKTTLITPIARQYDNNFEVLELDDLDKLCNVPIGTRHVVVAKERLDWLKSICNWGLSVGWFPGTAAALAAVPDLARDYDAYHGIWSNFEEKMPDRVAVLSYDDFVVGGTDSFSALYRLGLPVDSAMGALRIDEVPRSPKSRLTFVSVKDVSAALASQGSDHHRNV